MPEICISVDHLPYDPFEAPKLLHFKGSVIGVYTIEIDDDHHDYELGSTKNTQIGINHTKVTYAIKPIHKHLLEGIDNKKLGIKLYVSGWSDMAELVVVD